jgi:uncharacterized RDD family membrane protein YckC
MAMYAPLSYRFVALLIDGLLLAPVCWLSYLAPWPDLWADIVLLTIGHVYAIIGNGIYGQTVGKRLMDLRVVQIHELRPLAWRHAVWREIPLFIAGGYWMVPMLQQSGSFLAAVPLGFFCADVGVALLHPQHRSLHDFTGKTVVIRYVRQRFPDGG